MAAQMTKSQLIEQIATKTEFKETSRASWRR